MDNPKALVLIAKAQLAMRSSEWSEARSLCEEALSLGGLSAEYEGLARVDLASTLIQLTKSAPDSDARLALLNQGAHEARTAISRFESTASGRAHLVKGYMQLGVALGTAARLLPHGQARIQSNRDGISALENALRLEPTNQHLVKMLAAARRTTESAPEGHSPAKVEEKTGGCFIATAACGNPFAPEVIVLSAFRDDVLLGSRIGQSFVQLYYAVSPPIATVIARSSVLRRGAMVFVVRPAVYLVRAVFRSIDLSR